MSATTGIAWTDATWPIVTGCTKVSPGCKYCYAERDWARLAGNPRVPIYFGRPFGDVQFHPERLQQPLNWRGRPRMIFVPSMGDLFHAAIPDRAIQAVFGLMAATPQHTYQVLTKRPERLQAFLRTAGGAASWSEALQHFGCEGVSGNPAHAPWPTPNIWLGVTVENRHHGVPRIDLLREVPARVRFLSIEPLLEDLGTLDLTGIDWVIVGGESGPFARPTHPDWVRAVRDQCARAAVPLFFKQWGEWLPGDQVDALGVSLGEVQRASFGALSMSGNWDLGHYPLPSLADSTIQMLRLGRRHTGSLLDGQAYRQFPVRAGGRP